MKCRNLHVTESDFRPAVSPSRFPRRRRIRADREPAEGDELGSRVAREKMRKTRRRRNSALCTRGWKTRPRASADGRSIYRAERNTWKRRIRSRAAASARVLSLARSNAVIVAPSECAGHSPDDYRTESLSCTAGSRAGNAAARVSFVPMMRPGYDRCASARLIAPHSREARSRFSGARGFLAYERRSGI